MTSGPQSWLHIGIIELRFWGIWSGEWTGHGDDILTIKLQGFKQGVDGMAVQVLRRGLLCDWDGPSSFHGGTGNPTG